MQTTRPATARPLTQFDQMLGRTKRKGQAHNVSPLARAALDNGVSFADVQAYCESMVWVDDARRDLLESSWYEAVNLPANDYTTPALAAHVTDMVTDTRLEGALVRSVLAEGTVEHARLWWGGVL